MVAYKKMEESEVADEKIEDIPVCCDDPHIVTLYESIAVHSCTNCGSRRDDLD